jgi:phosphoribosyl 1,2-cyclic phosphate phosphodiesterase
MMRITILGSGGGLGIPNPFCACANCAAARASGGKSLRNAPAVLINDDLLVDCGPDVINSVRRGGQVLSGLRTLVITHRHSDHLDPWFFWGRRGVDETELPVMSVYAPQDTLDYVLGFYGQVMGWDRPQFEAQTRTAWRVVTGGMLKLVGRYRLRFFPAAHGDASMQVLLPGVLDAHTGYLHLYDTGPLPEETWAALRKHRFDVAALDATIGRQDDYANPGHMTAVQTIETAARLREEGILSPEGVALATHFVHQAAGRHEAEVQHYEPRGLTVAYDGLTLEPGAQVEVPLPVDFLEEDDEPRPTCGPLT